MRHGRLQIEGQVKMGKEEVEGRKKTTFFESARRCDFGGREQYITESRRRGDGRGLGRGGGGEREQGAKPCSLFN